MYQQDMQGKSHDDDHVCVFVHEPHLEFDDDASNMPRHIDTLAGPNTLRSFPKLSTNQGAT